MIPRRLPGIGLGLRRVAVDPRPDELLWAESWWTPRGRRLRACGRVRRPADESPAAFLERLAESAWLRHAEVALPIRHPELTLERLPLPKLSNRDASRVAARRLAKVLQICIEPANGGFALGPSAGERVAWLASCPTEFAGFAQQRWQRQGLDVSYFGHAHLALGALAGLVEPPAEGELHALLEVGADHGICAVADARGWAFSREFPIKIARARSPEELGIDPFERLATELRRTFQYVESELSMGGISRVVLSGVRDDLDELSGELATRLSMPMVAVGQAIPEGPAAGVDPALGLVLGLALEPALGDANLLPAPAIREHRRTRARRLLASTLAVPALLLLVVGPLGLGQLRSLRARSAEVEAEWQAGRADRNESEVKTRERAWAEQARTARAIASRARAGWTGGLRSLGLLLPDDAFAAALSAEHGELGWEATLDLEFRGDDLADAAAAGARFAERLDASPLWAVRDVSRGTGAHGVGTQPADASAVRSPLRVEAWLAPVSAEAPKPEEPSHG